MFEICINLVRKKQTLSLCSGFRDQRIFKYIPPPPQALYLCWFCFSFGGRGEMITCCCQISYDKVLDLSTLHYEQLSLLSPLTGRYCIAKNNLKALSIDKGIVSLVHFILMLILK